MHYLRYVIRRWWSSHRCTSCGDNLRDQKRLYSYITAGGNGSVVYIPARYSITKSNPKLDYQRTKETAFLQKLYLFRTFVLWWFTVGFDFIRYYCKLLSGPLYLGRICFKTLGRLSISRKQRLECTIILSSLPHIALFMRCWKCICSDWVLD